MATVQLMAELAPELIGFKRTFLVLIIPQGNPPFAAQADTITFCEETGSPYIPDIGSVQVAMLGHVLDVVYTATDRAWCPVADYDGGHVPPVEMCRCGFYALKEPVSLLSCTFPGAQQSCVDASSGIAEVTMFGDVFEGETGWRSSHIALRTYAAEPYCFFCGQVAAGFVPGEPVYPSAATLPMSKHHFFLLQTACPDHMTQHVTSLTVSQVTALLGATVTWGSHLPLSFCAPQQYPLDQDVGLLTAAQLAPLTRLRRFYSFAVI